MTRAAFLVVLATLSLSAAAKGSFELSRAEFLHSIFGAEPPVARRVWISGELKTQIADILDHEVGFMRAPYWRRDDTTVWVLDEIGKYKPITTAIVVRHDATGESRVQQVKVLAFRESRGWEVKYSFFTDQFVGIQRDPAGGLDRRIDGITGATMSVDALKKQAEAALLLNQHVQAQ